MNVLAKAGNAPAKIICPNLNARFQLAGHQPSVEAALSKSLTLVSSPSRAAWSSWAKAEFGPDLRVKWIAFPVRRQEGLDAAQRSDFFQKSAHGR